MIPSESPTTQAPPQSVSTQVKLPTITLPTFHGDPKCWSQFNELFEALIHSNPALSDVQKLVYLRSSLAEEASGIISSLPVNAANYPVARALLTKRFENKRNLTTHHLATLIDCPNASYKDASSLRSLADLLTEQLGALDALGHNTAQWLVILLFILQRKLDSELRRQWELTLTANPQANLNAFIDFLIQQYRLLEATNSSPLKSPSRTGPSLPQRCNLNHNPRVSFSRSNSLLVNSVNPSSGTNQPCVSCNGLHPLRSCLVFNSQTANQRLQLVKQHNLCLNCLKPHPINSCWSTYSCSICRQRHHTLLHVEHKPQPITATQSNPRQTRRPATKSSASTSYPPVSATQPSTSSSLSAVAVAETRENSSMATVLLATAIVEVQGKDGAFHQARVLLDPGSQSNFVSDTCANKLGLKRTSTSVSTYGLGETSLGVVSGLTHLMIKPINSNAPMFKVSALVIPKIAVCPATSFCPATWKHLDTLPLADPHFAQAAQVDILLGAELYPFLLTGQIFHGPSNTPSAVGTVFGFSLMGRIRQSSNIIQSFLSTEQPTEPSLNQILRSFWEIEEVTLPTAINPLDQKCESIYSSTVQRTSTGRYVVRLPFFTNPVEFGDSFSVAMKRFLAIERRFRRQPEFKTAYQQFMKDYIDQHHMTKITLHHEFESPPFLSFHIPHHAVMKANSSSLKIRVVFDDSALPSSGLSLNQSLHTGPKLQNDIASILHLLRLHPIVLLADIRQMYRQILIHPDDRRYQRILWRFDPEAPVEVYELNTVTYGLVTSPYLAIRTLHELVANEGHNYPLASKAIMECTYVDDVVCGASTLQEGLDLQSELINLLRLGGFELRKWVSNHPKLLELIPPEHCSSHPKTFNFDQDSQSIAKILGLRWDPLDDHFIYSVIPCGAPSTKRGILSEIARIFDPLGWLAPIILYAKRIIQQLWLIGLDYDDPPPVELIEKWNQFKSELPVLSSLTIPRHINLPVVSDIQLHGFADSSQVGLAAVVYLRVVVQGHKPQISLLAAKSKVAPVQQPTLPRLELCSNLLLANLIQSILNAYNLRLARATIIAWTDSTVALQWIRSSPHRWKTFIANRITQIQSILSPSCFRHVPSEHNPADCASRGLSPAQLSAHPLWWAGPSWLVESEDHWPQNVKEPSILESDPVLPEVKTLSLVHTLKPPLKHSAVDEALLLRASSLSTVRRLTGWWFRFIHNLKNPANKIIGPLTSSELKSVMTFWIRRVQQQVFYEEISALTSGHQPSSSLAKLNPFLDPHGILRVGGRLSHARLLSYQQKHPILLPKDHHFVNLIITYYHILYSHPGPQPLLAILRSEYWILAGRDIVRRRLLKCIRCVKAFPRIVQPPMGDLPPLRVQEAKAFTHVGVDYAGPYAISMGHLRNSKTHKAYICLFVCFCTKATHLELASDLSTDTFLAAMLRFVARRGRITHIFSDCGTNFVGAHHKLQSWYNLVSSKQHNHVISRALSDRGIEWHFNPPSAPHFGGLWEAGVRSAKRLLTKTIGEQRLTYEELATVLTQIEASLNSRPLCELSSDPNDFGVLTPGHFILQEPPFALTEPDVSQTSSSHLTRWALVRQISQHFWQRWYSEYLLSLHRRAKWTKPTPNLRVGQLVLIKDENLPPLRWNLGRVNTLHPGTDGVVRVVTLRTTKGELMRPVVKLCPLPVDPDSE